jgi:AcrR family transcriptional regulator
MKHRMQRHSQPVDFVRRTPRQARAQDTVQIIVEATARILQRQGRTALNTNYIAECAGISVGTLYQYFPNKEAILVTMARNELANDEVNVIKALTEPPGDGEGETDLVRRAIRVLITAYSKRREARRVAFETLISEGLGDELAKTVQKVAQTVSAESHRLLPERAAPITPASLFVITRAISGVLRAASQEQSPLLGTLEFENELVKLVQSYVAEPEQSPQMNAEQRR